MVRNAFWPQLFENKEVYSRDKSVFRPANVFSLMLLVRSLHRPMIDTLLPSFCIRDSYVYIEFFLPTVFIRLSAMGAY